MSTMPQRLKILRKEKKMTQKEFAELIGINRATYAMYESGNNQPKNETLKIIADFYGVSIDYLIGKEPDKIDLILEKITKLSLEEKIKWYSLMDDYIDPIEYDYIDFKDVFSYFNEKDIDKLNSYFAYRNVTLYLFLKVDKLSKFIISHVYKNDYTGLEINGVKVSSEEKDLTDLYNAITKSYKSQEEELLDGILQELCDLENPAPLKQETENFTLPF